MEGAAPTHNKYGFSIEDQEQHEKQEEYYNGRYSSEVEKQQARWAEWLSDNVVGVKLEGGATRPFVPHEAKENAELLDMARKGIPTEQRGMVWLGVSGGRDRLEKSLAGEGQLRYVPHHPLPAFQLAEEPPTPPLTRPTNQPLNTTLTLTLTLTRPDPR